jgi:parallel beta-helix repeat protein
LVFKLGSPSFIRILFFHGVAMRARLSLEQLEARDLPSTYFVATTGSDSAAGSSANPWLTLQYAVDHVKAGGIIKVESGTYAGCRIGNNGNFNSASGTASHPITLEADKGASVVVDAAGPNNYHGSDIEVENFSSTVQYWVINGIECEKSTNNAGIDIRTADHITIENCNCYDNYNWGIFLAFSNYAVLENNTCSYSVNQHGIYDSNSGDHATITGNTCDHNYGCGIEFNGDVSQGGKGYMAYNLIAGNIIYDNGAGGGAAINCDGMTNSTIENNLLYNNQAGGLVLYHADASKGSIDNIVVNNTIIMPSGSRWAVNISANSTGNVLYNNIIEGGGSGSGCIEISNNSLSGFVSDYNIFMGDKLFSINSGNSTMSLATWQSKTGDDAVSFTATNASMFVNASKNDYHLLSTSKAIGAGTSTDAPATDLSGNARPSNSIDIGCYQYVS